MAQEMIPHCQTLIAMGWPQPKSPIQKDNSTAVGVTNKTIVPHRAKMLDMQFWLLHCHTSQDQSRCYWDTGSKNWANYHTKHHPNTCHEAHQSSHAGYCSSVGTYPLPHTLLTRSPQNFHRKFSHFYFFDIHHVYITQLNINFSTL